MYIIIIIIILLPIFDVILFRGNYKSVSNKSWICSHYIATHNDKYILKWLKFYKNITTYNHNYSYHLSKYNEHSNTIILNAQKKNFVWIIIQSRKCWHYCNSQFIHHWILIRCAEIDSDSNGMNDLVTFLKFFFFFWASHCKYVAGYFNK